MIAYSILPEQIVFISTNTYGVEVVYKYVTN
jgi:hypothetical protein